MRFIDNIKAFFGIMESDEEYWNEANEKRKRMLYSLSDKDIQYLSSIQFEEQLDFTFKSVNKYDISACVAIGVIVALSAVVIDGNGKKMEEKINKVRVKDLSGKKVTIGEIDTSNAFDLKSGHKHRDYIGHDFNFFKSIPGDFVISKGKNAGKSLNEIIGIEKSYHSLYHYIRCCYELPDSFINSFPKIIKLTWIHMAKDVVTDDGLPIPFSSIATKFQEKLTNVCGYKNSNCLNDALGDELGHKKLSDLSTYLFVKALMNIYIKAVYKNEELSKRAKKILKNQMNIVIYATIISVQLIIMLMGKIDKEDNIVSGGKVNGIILKNFVYNCFQLIMRCNEDNKEILCLYKDKKVIIGAINMKYEMKEYKSGGNADYYFESNEDTYLNLDMLNKSKNITLDYKKWREEDIVQIMALFYLEELKIRLAEGKIEIDEFRKILLNNLKEFSVKYKFSIFDETKAHNKFYEVINKIYKGEL